MKLIIAVLLLTIGAFAHNTKYKDGTECKCDSILIDYYNNGNIKSELPIVGNQTHGIANVYYESGKIKLKIKYIFSINRGIISQYDDIVAPNTSYKDGTECKCDSIITKNWPSINASIETAYKNNKSLRVITYNNNIITSDYRYFVWNSDSSDILTEAFEYDIKTSNITRHYRGGNDTTWYVNGQIKSISENEYNVKNYKCDRWRGIKYTRYYENGKIKIQRSDLSSKCIQVEKSFYDNGNLAGIITYKNSEVVSNKCTNGRFGNENLDCLN